MIYVLDSFSGNGIGDNGWDVASVMLTDREQWLSVVVHVRSLLELLRTSEPKKSLC